METGTASCFIPLAAERRQRWPSALALPTSPLKTRVRGFRRVASGRYSCRRQRTPINTPGLRPCGYKTASGLGKWPNRDPISNQGFIITLVHHPIIQSAQLVFTAVGDDSHMGGYNFLNDSPINKYDSLGLCPPPPPCTSAPPLPDNSSACSSYGNGMYLGSSLSCFCKCAGNSPWAQQVRGCLACEFQQGTDISTAHHKCYAAAGGIMNGPIATLAYCWLECFGPPNYTPPPYPNPL